MRSSQRILSTLTGLMFFLAAPGIAAALTEFKSGLKDPQSGDTPRYDLCDAESASFEKNQALMRQLGLKRFPGASYNRLARGMIADTIENGIIVAMEKHPRDSIDAPRGIHERYIKSFREAYPNGGTEIRERDRFMQSTMNDPKPIHVTHIYGYRDRNACALYSAYPESRMCGGHNPTATHTYTKGMDALERVFRTRVAPELASGRYTHVMYMAMGWHNDQRVSICRYDAIASAISKASTAKSSRFRPYIIGVTWPSAWFSSSPVDLIDRIGHIGSVFNKADDSDEIGYLVGNFISNRLIPLANNRDLPFIALGHSFGTRVINRSVFSRDLLRAGAVGSGPDLTLALQPAHSIFRFLPGRGVEGHPFAGIDSIKTTLVATSSSRDTANPFAVWSRYVGGRTGLAIARYSGNREWLHYTGRDKSDGPYRAVNNALRQLHAGTGKPAIVDASGFVFEHNDVMSDDMGRFISGLIDRYAPARQ
ncbi:hypothetical protein [Hoeflea sp.]|uniref:hypothetical protein n=1 Tax=Hoeflea sp. TaxID=1940281 RepID=UPI003B51865B